MGGDEFVVLFDDVATNESALVIAERLSEALRAPYEIGTEWQSAKASIGVAVGPDGLTTPDSVVGAADAAMNVAKRRGGGRCVLTTRPCASRGTERARDPLAESHGPGSGAPRSSQLHKGSQSRSHFGPGAPERCELDFVRALDIGRIVEAPVQ